MRQKIILRHKSTLLSATIDPQSLRRLVTPITLLLELVFGQTFLKKVVITPG